MKKILIALDIDGTTSSDFYSIPKEVRLYLASLAAKGHCIAFITGRCFKIAEPILRSLEFPYFLAACNGAVMIQMPDRQMVSTQYLDPGLLSLFDKVVEGEPFEYILYTGIENGDFCYYRPLQFSPFFQDYFKKRAMYSGEVWNAVDSFEKIPLQSLAAIKLFQKKEEGKRIYEKICSFPELRALNIPFIRDPLNEEVYFVQATHSAVNKGNAVKKIQNGEDFFVVAAGDDLNDLPMLQEADVKIVMETAPDEVKQVADIIAPSADKQGIIFALEEALRKYSMIKI